MHDPVRAFSGPRGLTSPHLVGVLLAVLLGACSGSQANEPRPGPLRVLFVGNSLTYVNDLPSIVGTLAAATGRSFAYQMVAFPNASLEDHWNRDEARRAIAKGGWDYVVLQQGPSAAPESRVLLLEYTRRFAEEIRRVGARPALYMVWPSSQRAGDFDGVSTSYRLAAEAVDGLLLPAGDAWRAAWRRDPGLALYGLDGFHPALAGSYLAALVCYAQFFGKPGVILPARFETEALGAVALPEAQAALLQSAASEAVDAVTGDPP